MVSSSVYPGLERKPGGPDNWVERAGGLPSYIERIAKHLHYEQGYSISRAIATAVNTVKRWAAGGFVTEHGTTKRVTPKTQALAAKALAEWEAKRKAGSLNLSEALLAVIDLATQKCAMCAAPATKKVIWADGRAYQASCDAHVKDVQKMLTKKNGKMTELAGVQDLSDAEIEPTSTMVALMLPKEIAQKVAVEGGVPAEDMHVTVLFNGDLDDAAFDELVNKVKEFGADWQGGPLEGTIGGIGTFPAQDEEKGAPWWVPVDIPGLNTMYEQLCGIVGHASEHGYTPHMTLTYVKGSETPPTPVEQTPVTFSSVWVVRGNKQRVEVPLGGETGADLSEHAILSSSELNLPRGMVDVKALAKRAGRIDDPARRAAARQAVLDMAGVDGVSLIELASTIAPRNARGRATDGRRSYKGQGKWKHGFVPANKAAKEAKAKGSPIAIKRLNRLFGHDTAPDDARKNNREVAATGRAGQRSAGGRKNDAKGQVGVSEKTNPVAEKANDVAFFRHQSPSTNKNLKPTKDNTLPKSQKEASKSTRIPKRARQNWGEIPENLKTVRNGKRYVLAQFGGKGYLTEWVGGVEGVQQTALKNRKVMRTLSSADAANMSPAELRALVNNPQSSDQVKKAARKALVAAAKEPNRG